MTTLPTLNLNYCKLSDPALSLSPPDTVTVTVQQYIMMSPPRPDISCSSQVKVSCSNKLNYFELPTSMQIIFGIVVLAEQNR